MRLGIILWLWGVVGCATVGKAGPSPAPEETQRQIAARVQALLDAYAANDQAGVLALVDSRGGFVMYGSDVSEVVHDAAGLKQMMDNDFKLWHTARFGPVAGLDVRAGGALATAFFHVPFSVGAQPPLTVRITTVWRNVDGAWLLTQSANTVPTVGSSASEILQRSH
jgi:hypothetical protein